MNRTDYAQLHQCITRAVSELRGIAARLYLRDGASAELITTLADELMAVIGKLQQHREQERVND